VTGHPDPEDFNALGFAARQDAYRRLWDDHTRRLALDEKEVRNATRTRLALEAYDTILDKIEDFDQALRAARTARRFTR
jgi:hypothetical protein